MNVIKSSLFGVMIVALWLGYHSLHANANQVSIATFNIEWLGAPEMSWTWNGTRAEQISLAADEILSLDADILALQEIVVDDLNGNAFTDLIQQLNAKDSNDSWSGVLSPRFSYWWAPNFEDFPAIRQAFVWRNSKIDYVSGGILFASLPAEDPLFASGRLPLIIDLTAKIDEQEVPLTLINLHLKCCPGSDGRRSDSMTALLDGLAANYTDSPLVLLGDFNVADRGGAHGEIQEWGTYEDKNSDGKADFYHAAGSVEDIDSYDIDHILISDELIGQYLNTVEADQNVQGISSVSDHDPIVTKLTWTEESPEPGALPVYGTEASILVDGLVDAVWGNVSAQTFPHIINGSGCPATDFSATWRALWDSAQGKLVILVEVTDDNIITNASQSWFDDNIEIYLDGNNSKNVGTGGDNSGYDGVNDYQLRFVPRPDNNVFVAGASWSTDGIHAQYSTSDTGYVYEIELDLGLFGISPSLYGTTYIGFDIQISDNDDGWRDYKAGWFSTTDTNWYNPAAFGTIAFWGGDLPDPIYELAVLTDGPGSTSVIPEKSLYYEGEVVTLRAEPFNGYRFSHWSGTSASEENPLSLSIASNTEITAHFEPVPPDSLILAINCGGGQSVSPSGDVFEANRFTDKWSMSRSGSRLVEGSEHPDLFKSYQWHPEKVYYALPVPNGLYEVDLMWISHPYAGGNSVFDVSVAGVLVEDDFSVTTEAGGLNKAIVRTYPAMVTDGELRITLFRSTSWDPFINAIAVRTVKDPPGNASPVVHTVNKPGVHGSPVIFCPCDFSEQFFDSDGDSLDSIEITGVPLYGNLSLDGAGLEVGDVVLADDLERLTYNTNRSSQGRDLWQWRGFDGTAWSSSAAGVNIFLRAAADRVDNLNQTTWETYQWPFWAYYPEAEGGLVGADGIPRHGNACGPTSRTQVNFFWRYPRQGIGSLRFTNTEGSMVEANFGQYTFNYNAMPPDLPYESPESAYREVARLMQINDIMGIGIYGSGFLGNESFMPYFGFDGEMRKVLREDVDAASWFEILKQELNRGRILVMTGFNDTTGHYWLVTGYNNAGQVYAKMNYGGTEGWTDPDNQFSYYKDLEVILNFQPANLGQVLLYDPPRLELYNDAPNVVRFSAPNADTVDLEFSADNGWSWNQIASGIDASKGSYNWQPSNNSGSVLLRITDSDNINNYAETSSIQIVQSPEDPLVAAFNAFMLSYTQLSGSAAFAEADPDNDGIQNWIEFLLENGDPTRPDSRLMVEGYESNGSTHNFTWRLRENVSPEDVRCKLSIDPVSGSWQSADTVNGVTMTLTERTLHLEIPASLNPCFIRLEQAL